MPGQIFEMAGVVMASGIPLRRRWPWINVKETEADEGTDDAFDDSQPTEGER